MTALLAAVTAEKYELFVSFIMTPCMAIEMLAAEFMLAKSFKRRMYFHVRFFGSALACVLITILIEITFSLATGQSFIYGGTDDIVNTVFKIFYYIVILGMTYLCLLFSYKETPAFLATACAVGYAVQFLAANAAQLMQIASAYMDMPWNYIYDAAVYILTRVAVYVPLYFLLIRKHFKTALYSGNDRAKLLLLIITVVVCIFLSRLSVDDTDRTLLAMIVQPLYSIMCGALIIFVHFGLNANDSMHDQVAHISELLHQEREQYRLTKESIDIINEKCHDLKHQVARLREDGSERQIAQIENAIMIYDTNVKTGTYTSTASADGDTTHLDLTLSAADTVIRTESGKIAQNGIFTLNSEKWNAKMTENYKLIAEEGAATDSDSAAKDSFVEQFGGGYTVTIQEPTLDAEVPNLFAQIISITAAE